jgi:glucose-1-phosphate thymidylyltransferase
LASQSDITGSRGRSLVGLIPAAGKGSRLGRLPFSKELLPLAGPVSLDAPPPPESPTAIEHCLDTMAVAGIEHAHIIIAPEKRDIPQRVGNGSRIGMNLQYIELADSPSVPASLDCAFDRVQGSNCALLFPDIVFEPATALRDAVRANRSSLADVTLALVPSNNSEKVDIVTVATSGRVERIVPKPGPGISGLTWVAAVWSPRFSEFLHEKVSHSTRTLVGTGEVETYVGDILTAAIDEGMIVDSLSFATGFSFDLGTADELHNFWESGIMAARPRAGEDA